MGRGAVSRALRARNRGNRSSTGCGQKLLEPDAQVKSLVHKNKSYLVHYVLVGNTIMVIDLFHQQGCTRLTRDCWACGAVENPELINELFHRLAVTLSVETAKKQQRA